MHNNNIGKDITKIDWLAGKLERDIQSRGLTSGDPYLTATEAGELLGVSRATADRAMTVLAESELLLRRRSVGTFVGPAADNHSRSALQTVYVINPAQRRGILVDQLRQASPRSDSLIYGIRAALPDVNVQFAFLPLEDMLGHLRQLVHGAQDRGELAGVVAMGCPPEAYDLLAELDAPAVVFGHTYPGRAELPSIDMDHRQAGRLMTEYLTSRGHRRMALLAGMGSAPGDHALLDGIHDALVEADLPADAVTIRMIRREVKAAESVMHELWSEPEPPTAVLVRFLPLADLLADLLGQRGVDVPGDVEVMVQEYDITHCWSAGGARFPCVQAALSDEETAVRIGETLRQLCDRQLLEEQTVVVPAELCVDMPERLRARSLTGASYRADY